MNNTILPTEDDELTGRRPVKVDKSELARPTVESLRSIVKNQGYKFFTWGNDRPDYEPLLIDMFSASAMVQVYDAMNAEHKAKFERMVKASRAQFMKMQTFSTGRLL